MMHSRLARVVLWLIAMGLAAVIVSRARYSADLSAFLPREPSARERLLVDQLRNGPASRFILIAIEDGDLGTRVRLSTAMVRTLRSDPVFFSVDNGEPLSAERDQQFLFDHRYLLSEAVTAQRFSASGLKDAIDDTIGLLASPAGLLAKSLLPRDPTGETLQILNQLDRAAQPHSVDGVWTSADGKRALLVASMRAPGSDIDAAERALQRIRGAFAQAQKITPGAGARAARLVFTGPPVFAVSSRDTIRREAIRLSLLSIALIVSLLLVVYRSLTVLLLGLLPVASGALAGVAAVALGFGVVHGITLAFGITLIGESVDYSIYLFVQARGMAGTAVNAHGQQAALWKTILLGVLTSVCGFASLLPSGFPGLAQLGLYSITGLIAAALVTRFVLPSLLPPRIHIRDLTALGNAAVQLQERANAWRWLLGAIAAAALLVIYLQRDSLWNRDLGALSPVSDRAQRLDAELRADVGAPDISDFIVVTGPDLQAVLRSSEKVAAALEPLVTDQVIGGFDTPTRYLPSAAVQAARRASLPQEPELRERLKAATAALPVRAERLEPFVADVGRARAAPPLTLTDLQGTSFAAGFDALTMRADARWSALMPLHAVRAGETPTPAALDEVRAAVETAADGQAVLLNLKSESDALYSSYLSEALRLSATGFAAIVVLLLLALHSPKRVVRVITPLLLAVLSVAAGLLLEGRRLTILHLIGMLLIVAVGSNYALFFDRTQTDPHAGIAPLTLASLVIANATTVVGFGVLAFSTVPVLAALGSTVAPGAFLALIFSAALSRARPERETNS